jgi:eukaryotic-like serine/threonine-protein kinase
LKSQKELGTVIGPYKLVEQIGEGVVGAVFLAEQTYPVRRKVAVKVLKPGTDTPEVVARFEAERQALAIMDHPNIVKIYDAGATDKGRPYFVMELINGVPITDFCDQNHLTPRERLELFFLLCQAVQHAHQKGIIHRDLKPTDILVTVRETTPHLAQRNKGRVRGLVKLIDFGVAKAPGGTVTNRTLFLRSVPMIGTPPYMSPEQAGQSPDVDTRSDIYSLGVLLYELLTGTTPFAKERFKDATEDQIRRIISDEAPPKPSTKLSESKDSLPLISAELDWIVMKCLEKDPSRRYETTDALARKIEHCLNDDLGNAGWGTRNRSPEY